MTRNHNLGRYCGAANAERWGILAPHGRYGWFTSPSQWTADCDDYVVRVQAFYNISERHHPHTSDWWEQWDEARSFESEHEDTIADIMRAADWRAHAAAGWGDGDPVRPQCEMQCYCLAGEVDALVAELTNALGGTQPSHPNPKATRSTTLYRFYDTKDRLLYVGISGNPGRRFSEHGKDKDWWTRVHRSTMEHFPTKEQAAAAEVAAIVTECPLHNVTHNGSAQQPSSGRAPQIQYVCDVCHRPVANGDGYIQTSIQAAGRLEDRDADEVTNWQTLHRSCDPNVYSMHYWWAVERLRSARAVHDFERHIKEKRWSSWTDLDDFVNELLSQ